MNKEIVNQNLYEIPSCTICLNQLAQDIANLACGHVFHFACINQQFQYRGSCPNCQKRSNSKEVRSIHFPLLKNNQSGKYLRDIINNLNPSQKNQIEGLLVEIKIVSERNQKNKQQIQQYQKQLRKIKKQLNDTITQLNRKKSDSQTHRKEILECKKVIQSLHIEIKIYKEQDLIIRKELQEYREKEKQFQRFKSLKKIMNDNSQSLVQFKRDLQAKNIPPQQMAKQFFQMIQLKHMELRRIKQKMEFFPQKIADKDNQIKKLKAQIQQKKKEIETLFQKKATQKKKYDQLKIRYKKLVQRYKTVIQGNETSNQNQNDLLFFSYFTQDSQGNAPPSSGSQPRSFILQKQNQKANIQMKNIQAQKRMTNNNEESSEMQVEIKKQNNSTMFNDLNIEAQQNVKQNKKLKSANLNENNKTLLSYYGNNSKNNQKGTFDEQEQKNIQKTTKQTQLNFSNNSLNFNKNNYQKQNSSNNNLLQANNLNNQYEMFNPSQQTKLNFGIFTGARGGLKKQSDDFNLIKNTTSSVPPPIGKMVKSSMKNLMM